MPHGLLLPGRHQAPSRVPLSSWNLEQCTGVQKCVVLLALSCWIFLQQIWSHSAHWKLCSRCKFVQSQFPSDWLLFLKWTRLTNLFCPVGFYCAGGAKTAMPDDGLTGNRCPTRYYCPQGCAFPLQCPDGTHSNSTGIHSCALQAYVFYIWNRICRVYILNVMILKH